jgi:hypothetical protein
VLFPRYEKQVDLPASDSVQDIDVPEDAANAAPPSQETPSFVNP